MTSTTTADAQRRRRYRDPMTAPTSARPVPAGWLRQAVRRPAVVDVGLWIAVSAPLLAGQVRGERADLVGELVTMGLALVLIVARRRWPIPTLAAGLVAAVAATAILERPTALLPVTVVLLFHVAVTHDRRVAIRAGIAGLVCILSCIVILLSGDFLGPELLAGLAWPTLAVAAGDAVRSRAEAIAAAEERADRAEATRDAAVRQRVVEERLHIARELHDVVAHHIAVINVQAGVAAHLLDDRPDRAKEALTVVRDSAQQVLGELADILGVLRTADDDEAAGAPVPGLRDIASLVASFERVGLDVDDEIIGAPDPVSEATAVAVYRTVQEALTNAHKYGDGSARLRLRHRPGELEVVVTNRTSMSVHDLDATGFGLVGMRERVQAAGGELSVGRDDDDLFAVRARFPLAVRHEASA